MQLLSTLSLEGLGGTRQPVDIWLTTEHAEEIGEEASDQWFRRKCPFAGSRWRPETGSSPLELMFAAVTITCLGGASGGETTAGIAPRALRGRYRIRTRPRGAHTHVGLATDAVAAVLNAHGAWSHGWKKAMLDEGLPTCAAAAAVGLMLAAATAALACI